MTVIRDGNGIMAFISMKRNFMYHITATFVPTVAVMFIAIMPLYFDKDHIEMTVMLALTAMLVMYTL